MWMITQLVPRIQTPLTAIEGSKHTTSKGVGGFNGCGSNDGGGAKVAGGDGWLGGSRIQTLLITIQGFKHTTGKVVRLFDGGRSGGAPDWNTCWG
jgi:hypothetical protein